MAKAVSSYNITKRDDGRWYVQIKYNGDKIYIYGKTKNEVQSKLKQKLWDLEQAKAANLVNFAQSEKITVEQWARRCLDTYCKDSVKPNTYAGYQSIIEHHLGDIGSMKLGSVTNASIQKLLQDKARSETNEDASKRSNSAPKRD